VARMSAVSLIAGAIADLARGPSWADFVAEVS
jgi:hypothetical protein